MTPSEINRLVAKHIFKLKPSKGMYYTAMGLEEGIMCVAGHDHPVPNYCLSISDAILVVEKLKMTVSAPGAPYASGEYANDSVFWEAECTKNYTKDWSDTVSSRAETMPMAVCLTALAAYDVIAPDRRLDK